MSEYKKLKDNFDKKVDFLQKNCEHKNISEEAPYYWAPGHSGGLGRNCLYCGKFFRTNMLLDSNNNILKKSNDLTELLEFAEKIKEETFIF